jgi:phosphoribosyl-ATP pyrophosphohydrolase
VKRRTTCGQGIYHSRSRGLWVKGESSGATQDLLAIDADCDRDCLRFTVRQKDPGFCHLDTRTCWGEDRGLPRLLRRLEARLEAAPAGSYTARLFKDRDLLGAKLREEALELASAPDRDNAVEEAADVLFFTLATLAARGIDLDEVEAVLDRRALKVTRRE